MKKEFFHIYKLIRLLSRAFRNYKKAVLSITVLGFFSGFFEAIGISVVIPIFSLITGGQDSELSAAFKYLIDTLDIFGLKPTMATLLLLIVIFFILRAIFLIVANYIKVTIIANYEAETRGSILELTLRSRWSYLMKQKLGNLETLLMLNVSHGERLLNSLSSAMLSLSTLLMYLVVAVSISFPMTAITVLLGIILFMFFYPLTRKSQAISYEVEKLSRLVAHHVSESIFGIKAIKSMFVHDSIVSTGKQYFETFKKNRIKILFLGMIPGSLFQPAGLILIVGLFAFFYKTSQFNLAVLAAVVYLIQRILLNIQQFQSHIQIINESSPYIAELMSYKDEVLSANEWLGGNNKFSFDKEFKFENVSFQYSNETPVLKNINLSIIKGKMTAIIGPSGAGKTTIFDIFLRLLNPDNGSVTIDGVNVDSIRMEEWRKSIGYVSQDIFLINDTIKNNIKFYNESILESDIKEAARKANILEFIESLPQGFDTQVGEQGVNLSGGQRQRVIIARALARKPKLLLLDEATSALDAESEGEIQKAIESLKGRLTIVVIAHRLSTVSKSDTIIAIDNGNVIEQGSPSELLANPESYFSKVQANDFL